MARLPSEFAPLGLGPVAYRLLAPALGALAPPIRALLLGASGFAELGRSLAQAQEVAGPFERRETFFPRLNDNLRILHDARLLLEAHAQEGHHLAPAAGWLIDNASLLERQFDTVRLGLPRRYFAKLPRLRDPPLAGLPRVYGLAWAWVAHSDSGLDEDLLELFLGAYQAQRELTLAELWAVPTTLRVLLIENLRRLAERAATTQAARDAAHHWVERPPARDDAELLDQLGQALFRRGVLEAFALQLQRRSDDWPADRALVARAWLSSHLPDPGGALQRQHQQAAEDHHSVRNAVTSLRGLDRVAWRGVLLRRSAALAELQRLPVFTAESDETQDLTLHDIERLARQAVVAESRVSAVLARLASPPAVAELEGRAGPGATGDAPACAAPQYWLRGEGRGRLVRELGLRDPFSGWRAVSRRLLPLLYGAILTAGTAGLVAALLHRGAAPDLSPWAGLLTAVLLAGPASEAVVALLHRLISESMPPERLPRLAWDEGIPPAHRPIVVVPAMLTGLASTRQLVAQLEQHHLANPERTAQFALLTDVADAPAEHLPGDDALLNAAREGIAQLNHRYPVSPGDAQRFLLLHRGRRWSDSEQCWMGWERKRGKLEALVVWLAEQGASPFADLGALSAPAADVRCVVTLDADTDMPPGRLRELVSISAHPLNRPVVDVTERRVTAGYGILQPRLVVPLPRAGTVTAFHWLFSGQTGIDPYSAASSEIYQDLFGEGSFTGKGLLDVRAVHATLSGRLPDGQVLSHDLLEGALARCASVSDVTLVEDAPAHPDVAASRVHRWTRGDWQLLPFILQRRRWPMAGINRWKMLDNLRRSLVAPCAVALLGWVLASDALPLPLALWLIAAAYGAGPLLGAIASLAPSRDDIAPGLFFSRTGGEVFRALAGTAWHLAQLMTQAVLGADAIVRALVRQYGSRRHLLQWTTAAAAARAAARSSLPTLLRRHRVVSAAAVAFLLAVLALRAGFVPGQAPWASGMAGLLVLVVVWAASPLVTWAASLRLPARGQCLSDAGRDRVRQLARDTWTYYDQYVNASDHHLPPDNVQMTGPEPVVAHRTSPTNIGMYLLTAAAVCRLGFIGRAELADRLERTLGTLDRLPRWRGHCYNWYDTQRLVVLPPAYVSAVDSGNLCGHLMVLASACESLADGEATGSGEADGAVCGPVPDDEDAVALAQRLRRLAGHARALALAADFRALYDPRRRLLHIGHDVDADRADPGHYDLLASEARLASLFAIAKGDIPPRHWSSLGRPLFATAVGWGWGVGLKSWSGSMFEYLMPSLVLEEPPGSLLHAAIHAAVAVQRQSTRPGMPWGISESAIAVQDHTLAYQYGPQGVARLALRRTPADELVVAPYASVMALLVAPQAAADNLALLETLGVRRPLGFVEALDYTPRRQPAGAHGGFTAVETFMAHHQAMSLLACAHVLTGGAVHAWAAREPHFRAVLSLLHERAPHQASVARERPAAPVRFQAPTQGWQFHSRPLSTPLPPTHVLGNDRYAVVLRANGAGFSQWQGHGLSRWRDDALRDDHGLFGHVRRPQDLRWLPLAAHPAADEEADKRTETGADVRAEARADYRTEFFPDRVVLHARWGDLHASTTVSVSTADDCELRTVVLSNPGSRPLRLTLAMAFEATLAPQAADEAHPAFSNLFVQACWSPCDRAMFLQRRPRLSTDRALHAVHFLAACDDPLAQVGALADRARWLGRLGHPGDPLPVSWPAQTLDEASATPTQALDTGLDPVSVISVALTVPPRGSRTLSFVLGAAQDEATLKALVDRYQQPASAERALRLSDTLARIRLRELRLDPEAWVAWLHLNTLLVNQLSRKLAVPMDAIDRRLLWRHGIGGERPILAVWIESAEGIDLVRQLVAMLGLWTAAGVALDLVVVNAEPASYPSPVQQAFIGLTELAAMAADPRFPPERRASLNLLVARELQAAEQATLRLLARVTLQADGRALSQQVERLNANHEDEFGERLRQVRRNVSVRRPRPDAEAPIGHFDASDAAFRFALSAARHPLRPWINVLSNPDFGSQVSEAAAGFTWAANSRMHQITAASNDALCDPPVEAVFLEDLDKRRVWWLGRGVGVAREVAHGLGQTRMRQVVDGLSIEMVWCVDAQWAVKQLSVDIAVQPGQAEGIRHLRLVGFAEWTLGARRGDRATLVTRPYRWLAAPGHPVAAAVGFAVMATQRDASGGHGGATAFLCWQPDADEDAQNAPWLDLDDWTCDRREFFDASGRWVVPGRLRGGSGAGLDACGAVACRLTVQAGRSARAALLLGHAESPEAATRAAQQACHVAPNERLARQLAVWPALLGDVQVQTPDPVFDALVNHWLPYQSIACRLWARAGFYQAGGAFGFRDQLQDAMNLVDRAPQLLARQIVLHAGRQFPEGDVQHWWHAPEGAGVRTRMSDDLLWLPLALAHGLRHGLSPSLLDQRLPFLIGGEVPEGQEDLYETPALSEETASVYEHAARTLDHSLVQVGMGAHGLPLMGTGDWNDGMNRVGALGRGESVWMGWFLCRVIDDFAPLAELRGDAERAQRWRTARQSLAAALETEGWDGQWYRRAFFDDGSPLGSSRNAECRIDLIAQAWSVLSGAGDPARADTAMASAAQGLWDPRTRLMRLLDPPLALAQPEAGYIQAYPPGIRENGGQYNHAAVWALMAFAQRGDAAWTWRLFEALSPLHRGADAALGAAYRLEPYVLAGDIYSHGTLAGQGGWSWYTGAASWLQRAALESICGIQLDGGLLRLQPCLPPHWSQVTVSLQRDGRSHQVTLFRDLPVLQAFLARFPLAIRVGTGQPMDLASVPEGARIAWLAEGQGMPRAAPPDAAAFDPVGDAASRR